jgi:hypothetical protein
MDQRRTRQVKPKTSPRDILASMAKDEGASDREHFLATLEIWRGLNPDLYRDRLLEEALRPPR